MHTSRKTIFDCRRLLCAGWCLFFIYIVLVITAGTLIVYFTDDHSKSTYIHILISFPEDLSFIEM